MSNRPTFNGPFVAVPSVLLADTQITSDALRLWCFIYDLCGQSGYCWASNETLANYIGKSVTSTKRYLKQLKHKGYIDADYSSNNNNTERQITIIPEFFDKYNKPLSKSKSQAKRSTNEPHSGSEMSRKQFTNEPHSGSNLSPKRSTSEPLSITSKKELNNNIDVPSKVFTKFIAEEFIPKYPKKAKQDLIWEEVTKVIDESPNYTVKHWNLLCVKIRKHIEFYSGITQLKYMVSPVNYIAARKWREPIEEKTMKPNNVKNGSTNDIDDYFNKLENYK